MLGGLNLHALVRGAINSVHPDLDAVLYRNTGQETIAGGNIIPSYAKGLAIKAQRQSESATTLAHADKVGQENVSRKFYLYSDHQPKTKVAGIVRPLARGGDMFKLVCDKTWWLVDAIIEDFTASGWVCVRATLQVNGPEFGSAA